MRAPSSLQGRLLLAVLGLLTAIWLATAMKTWIDARHELDELLDSHLAQAAAVLVVQQVHEIDEGHGELGLSTPSLHRYAPKAAFQVWHEGQLVLRSDVAPQTPLGPIGKPYVQGFSTQALNGQAWRVFATHGAERDVQVFVGELLEARRDILRSVMRNLLGPMVIAMPLLALLLWWAIRHSLVPLRVLGSQLRSRNPAALEPLSPAGAPTELLPVITALNGLFDRIDSMLQAERRFTADAAHELRTPLAALRAQAQVALASREAGERTHALHNTLAATDRLGRLVDQLLTLSRLDASGPPAPMARLNLVDLARNALSDASMPALAKDQELGLDAPDQLSAWCNETLCTVLLRNLLDNAIRYSPSGSRIQVTLETTGDAAHITVQDSGPGLRAEDRARLGERFFRVLGHDAPGSGLGWSIVRRIADVHHATLTVDDSPELGGLRVRIGLPTAPASA